MVAESASRLSPERREEWARRMYPYACKVGMRCRRRVPGRALDREDNVSHVLGSLARALVDRAEDRPDDEMERYLKHVICYASRDRDCRAGFRGTRASGIPVPVVSSEAAPDAADPSWWAGPSPAPSPEDEAIGTEVREAVARCVAMLPGRQRQVVEATLLLGRSYAEVAGELGISEGAVGSHRNVGIRRLRSLLASECPSVLAENGIDPGSVR